VRYRSRRHKLGSQGTGDAAGFTFSPPVIALFLFFFSHSPHHSFPLTRSTVVLLFNFMQIYNCPNSLQIIIMLKLKKIVKIISKDWINMFHRILFLKKKIFHRDCFYPGNTHVMKTFACYLS